MKFKRVPPPAELKKLLPGVKVQESPWYPTGVQHRWESKAWRIDQHRDGSWGALLVHADIHGECARAATLKEAIAQARKDWRKQRNYAIAECTHYIRSLMKEVVTHTRMRDKLRSLKVL